MLHDAHHAFHNVIDVSEIALAVAVVEYPDGFAFHQFIGEAEVCHIGSASRAIHREKAQAGTRNVIELAVGMSHQFIALLGSRIEADGIIHLVIGGVRHFLVAAVHAATAGVNQVFHSGLPVIVAVAASLQDVVKTDKVGRHVSTGIGDAVTYARLRG